MGGHGFEIPVQVVVEQELREPAVVSATFWISLVVSPSWWSIATL